MQHVGRCRFFGMTNGTAYVCPALSRGKKNTGYRCLSCVHPNQIHCACSTVGPSFRPRTILTFRCFDRINLLFALQNKKDTERSTRGCSTDERRETGGNPPDMNSPRHFSQGVAPQKSGRRRTGRRRRNPHFSQPNAPSPASMPSRKAPAACPDTLGVPGGCSSTPSNSPVGASFLGNARVGGDYKIGAVGGNTAQVRSRSQWVVL